MTEPALSAHRSDLRPGARPAPHTTGDAIAWICETCGTQFAPTLAPPERCPICDDERQYVGWGGQTWATPDALAARHAIRIADEAGVMTLELTPGFAINQRAFRIPDPHAPVLWECLSLVTDEAVAALRAAGGIAAIAISHPHFYSAMAAWSEALGGVPIYLHEADRAWVQHASPNLRFWSGDRLAVSDDVELVHLPGHFAGSAGLWWKRGPRPGGSLFPGDALQVTMDRRHATFLYSYPNLIPLGPTTVEDLRRRVAPLAYDDVFGFTAGRQIVGGARAAIDASFDRYLARVRDQPSA
jgi:hypothetical protein